MCAVQRYDDTGGLEVTLASTALVGLGSEMRTLSEYPYGCTEQLTSRLLPLVPLSELARERLKVIRETSDGFEIARRDLELRGPGELLGTRQTGLAQLRVADLMRDADLLLVMDGVRQDIYAGTTSNFARSLNVMAGEVAAASEIPFIDLHDRFAADWNAHRQRFEFVFDGHWNERAHELVAGAIAESIGATALTRQRRIACR